MKKGFLGGLFGCLGVGVAILLVIIVIGVAMSGNKSGNNTRSSGSSSSPAPVGTKVLLDMSGNGIKNSATFHAPDEWTIDYTYDCTAFGSQGNFAITVEGDTFDVAANALGTKGSDTANVHGGGNVHLGVNSECSWHVIAKG